MSLNRNNRAEFPHVADINMHLFLFTRVMVVNLVREVQLDLLALL